jgi:hypothetical protein
MAARPIADIPSCALTQRELIRQRRRYARLSGSTSSVVRAGATVLVDFHPDFDRRTLEQAMAVERECCPFFELAFEEDARRLTIAVRDPGHAPALDAIAESLGAVT